jgi:transcriptional regulator with XRE-family HTH domain
MTLFGDFINEALKDPEFKKEYDALELEYIIIQAMINARKNYGITKAQIAEKTGIAISHISRLENANANHSLRTLKRLAAAMNTTLKIGFVPIEK